ADSVERKPTKGLEFGPLDVQAHELDEGWGAGPSQDVGKRHRGELHERRLRRLLVPAAQRLVQTSQASCGAKPHVPACFAEDYLLEHPTGATFHVHGKRVDAEAGPTGV